LIHEPEPIQLERSAELTGRIILRQMQADPHCRRCRKRLNPALAVLLDYNGRFPDVVCLACQRNALKGDGP